MAFLENTDYYNNWDDMSANDHYLSSLDKYMYNTSNTKWNNAAGRGRVPSIRPNPGQVSGGPCSVTVTFVNKSGDTVTNVCNGTLSRRGKCKPCHKMAGVGRVADSISRGYSGGYSNAAGSGCGYSNASGCGYSNAAGGPVINVGGDTYDMQPTLAWNQGDFFGQPQGFEAGNLVCEACPQGFRGTRQACGGTGCYNRLGQRLAESGTGIPPGMSVQYTQV
jgi:hypothetical protein